MKGQCLCGAVRLTVPEVREAGACHCDYCRRWGGGPLLSVHCGPDVVVEGREHVAVYASSAWAERAFCRHCGSHLYYRMLGNGSHFVPAGLLEDAELELTMQIFIDRKPGYYALANQTPMLTGEEVMRMFAGGEGQG